MVQVLKGVPPPAELGVLLERPIEVWVSAILACLTLSPSRMTSAGPVSAKLPCGNWEAPYLQGCLLCVSLAFPTCPDRATYLTFSAWESLISLRLSSPDPFKSSCHTHHRRILWGWDTSSWS